MPDAAALVVKAVIIVWRSGCSGGAPHDAHARRSPASISGLARQGVLIALALLILFGALRYDHFLGAFNVLSVLRYNSMFALIALGMCFVIMTGGIDLSVGSTAAMSQRRRGAVSALRPLPGLLGGLAPVPSSACSTG